MSLIGSLGRFVGNIVGTPLRTKEAFTAGYRGSSTSEDVHHVPSAVPRASESCQTVTEFPDPPKPSLQQTSNITQEESFSCLPNLKKSDDESSIIGFQDNQPRVTAERIAFEENLSKREKLILQKEKEFSRIYKNLAFSKSALEEIVTFAQKERGTYYKILEKLTLIDHGKCAPKCQLRSGASKVLEAQVGAGRDLRIYYEGSQGHWMITEIGRKSSQKKDIRRLHSRP